MVNEARIYRAIANIDSMAEFYPALLKKLVKSTCLKRAGSIRPYNLCSLTSLVP